METAAPTPSSGHAIVSADRLNTVEIERTRLPCTTVALFTHWSWCCSGTQGGVHIFVPLTFLIKLCGLADFPDEHTGYARSFNREWNVEKSGWVLHRGRSKKIEPPFSSYSTTLARLGSSSSSGERSLFPSHSASPKMRYCCCQSSAQCCNVSSTTTNCLRAWDTVSAP